MGKDFSNEVKRKSTDYRGKNGVIEDTEINSFSERMGEDTWDVNYPPPPQKRLKYKEIL